MKNSETSYVPYIGLDLSIFCKIFEILSGHPLPLNILTGTEVWTAQSAASAHPILILQKWLLAGQMLNDDISSFSYNFLHGAFPLSIVGSVTAW